MRVHVPETGWHHIHANGLEHAVFDDGDGPLVLMQHGFPDTPHTFDECVEPLVAAGFRVVRPWGRGISPSQKPQGDAFDVRDLAADLIGLIDALGEERAYVVGHDWGAAAAWGAAHIAPHKIERLITVAIPHPASIVPTPRKIWGVRHFLTNRFRSAEQRFRADDFAEIRAMYERWSPGFDWPEEEFEAAKNAYASPGSLDSALGYYRRIGLWPFRGSVRTDTVVIGGLTDGVATRRDFERSPQSVDGPCEVVMMAGGHFLHREHPNEFLEVLMRALRLGEST